MDPLVLLFAVVVIGARMLPIVELVPVLSGPWVPRSVRLAVALGLTLLVAPVAFPASMWSAPPGLIDAVVLVVRELLVGAALGFVSSLVFEAARMTGGIVDRLTSTADGDGPVARLYLLIAVVLFFGLGGGPLWLFVLGQSYVLLPLDGGGGVFDGLVMARMVADAIALAVLLALPVLAVVLLAELCLAAAARVSEVMSGTIPASSRTLVAVAAVALSLGVFTGELGGHIAGSLQDLPAAIEGLYVH